MEDLSDLLQKATKEKLRKFEEIKGKPASSFPFPFWDVVIISAADEAQSFAFQQQINEKLEHGHLPRDVKYFCFPDPGASKIGPGGSLMAVAHMINQFFGGTFHDLKILFIPSGGFSQRLPNCSLLGKIFMTLPLGDPIYQMLELKLAMHIDFPARMKSGLYLANTDTFILYDADNSSDWAFDRPGITALGHPAPPSLGVSHGVFVIDRSSVTNEKVSISECNQFLHKVQPDIMRQKGAVLPKEFSDRFGEDEIILIDSGYYIDMMTIKKLIEFYSSIQPLECEIDSHGDFLQALGKNSNMDYIHNTQNVVSQSKGLLEMRQRVFKALQGTQLWTLVLRDSKFYHIGTTEEYLHHLTSNNVLCKELGVTADSCNLYLTSDGKATYLHPEKGNNFGNQYCFMSSSLPLDTSISGRCVLEFCRFSGKLRIGNDAIISNCSYKAPSLHEVISIPSNVFLHTVCVNFENKRSFVTIVYNNDDNLKKKVQKDEAQILQFLGKPLEEILKNTQMKPQDLFEGLNGPCTLWNARFFQPKPSMDESFKLALDLVKAVREDLKSEITGYLSGGLSVEQILCKKDVEGMLKYRREIRMCLSASKTK